MLRLRLWDAEARRRWQERDFYIIRVRANPSASFGVQPLSLVTLLDYVGKKLLYYYLLVESATLTNGVAKLVFDIDLGH